VHEGGIATPFIVRWPGQLHAPAGSFVREVGHIIDILPTCLELADASYPKTFRGRPALPVEGRSLMPIFQGNHSSEVRDIFWEWAGNAAMRRGDWKMVWDKLNEAGRWELYDMAKDRTEIHDAAKENAAKVQELRAAYERWAKATRRAVPGPAL
jgi:arylsulfatase